MTQRAFSVSNRGSETQSNNGGDGAVVPIHRGASCAEVSIKLFHAVEGSLVTTRCCFFPRHLGDEKMLVKNVRSKVLSTRIHVLVVCR